MSSSFVKDCTDSSGTSSSRGNKTFIIFVNNDSATVPPIEGQEFQNLLVNHGADPSNVSVLQMGQPQADLDFELPQLAGVEGLGAGASQQNEPLSNFMMDNFSSGFAELPIDEDAIKKLESVLHTQEAKDILGDALLDMVNNPLALQLQEQLPSEESGNNDGMSVNVKRGKSPKRRSQRQMDKAEREEVEKILAENQLMLQKEREELRKEQQEKEEAEEQQRANESVNLKEVSAPEQAVENKEEKLEPSKSPLPKIELVKISKGKTKPPGNTIPSIDKGKNKLPAKTLSSSGKGKTLPVKSKSRPKKAKVVESSTEKSVPDSSMENISSSIKLEEKPLKVEIPDQSLKLMKGVLKEVSVNLEKLEVKNFRVVVKNDDSEFDGFTAADTSTAGDKLRESLSPVKSAKLPVEKTEDVKSLTCPDVSSINLAVIQNKDINCSELSPNNAKTHDSALPDDLKTKKNVTKIKQNKTSTKELSLINPDKTKSKNTNLCPPISKSLMNYKIPHKNANKTFYTSGYKKETINKTDNNSLLPKKEFAIQKSDIRKQLVNPNTPKKIPTRVDSPKKIQLKVDTSRVSLERSISAPPGAKLESNPVGKHLNIAKTAPIKRPRPSFEVALNSSKEIQSKAQKPIEKSNILAKQQENSSREIQTKSQKPIEKSNILAKQQDNSQREFQIKSQKPIERSNILAKQQDNSQREFQTKSPKSMILAKQQENSHREFQTKSQKPIEKSNILTKQENSQREFQTKSPKPIEKYMILAKQQENSHREFQSKSPKLIEKSKYFAKQQENSQSEFQTKSQKPIEKSNILAKQQENSSRECLTKAIGKSNFLPKQELSKVSVKMGFPIKTTTVHIKTKTVVRSDSKESKNLDSIVDKNEIKIQDIRRNSESERKYAKSDSPVRKSKRPAKKKQFDEQFVCLNEEISSDDDESDLTESDSEGSESSVNEYDDPKRLWCICQKPHNHRFMICCDSCEDWFHGSCVGVTKGMGKIMERNEEEWNCPRCNPSMKQEFRKKLKKSKLRKWSDDPKTTNQDPSEARVLVFEKSTGIVLSGTAAPTLSILQEWLGRHKGYAPLLPSMMNSVTTNPLTGMKSVKLDEADESTITLSSDGTSPAKIPKKKEEVREHKVSKARESGIIMKDSAYDFDPEFQPLKFKSPKKAILIDSIHPENLSRTIQAERFYKKELKKVEKVEKLSQEKAKHIRKDRLSQNSDRRSSQTDTDLIKKLAPVEKSPKLNIRNNVKKMLFDALTFRKSQTPEEFVNLTQDQLNVLCLQIEEQLFCTFNKDVGFKYKSRYRSLVFNIKDSKNGGLYRQILSGTVSPSKLATMTSEELASKELAEWRQQAEKKELEAIQKHELEMLQMKKQYVMKTHKGEIEIDKDDFNKTKENAPELVNMLPEKVSIDEEETPDQINHKNHIYDPLCSICIKMNIETKELSLEKHTKSHKEKKSHKSKRKKRDRDKEDKHERRRSNERHRHDSGRRRDSESDKDGRHYGKPRRYSEGEKRHSNKRHSELDEKHNKRRKEEKMIDLTAEIGSEREVVSTSDDVVYLPTGKKTVAKDAEPTSTVVGSPIDQSCDDPLDILLPTSPVTPPFLETSAMSPRTPDMSVLSDIEDDLQSPATPPLPGDTDRHTPPPAASATKPGSQQPIWRGGISMQDVATFNAAAFEVSGKAKYFTRDVPNGIDIVGRINPDTVWSYITEMKKTGSKEILVIRFQPSSEDEKVSYISLYCYLSSKKRYGVVGNCEKSVKDFYIVPLAAHQPIPQVLLPLDGPGFAESRPHMLIGVVIRSKHRRIYDTQSGVWLDVGEPPKQKRSGQIASDSPRSIADSPPTDFEEESYTPPQLPEAPEDLYSERSPSPPAALPEPKASPSRAQFDMLAELNRQIQKEKEEISNMQKTFDQGMDDTPFDDEKTKTKPEIKLPSNLQDILDNIKRKEVAIKDKEMEIERRINLATDDSDVSTNPFGVSLAKEDVDLRLLLPQKRFEPSGDEFARKAEHHSHTSLSQMTDEELVSKASELEERPINHSKFDMLSTETRQESRLSYHHETVGNHMRSMAGHPIHMEPSLPKQDVPHNDTMAFDDNRHFGPSMLMDPRGRPLPIESRYPSEGRPLIDPRVEPSGPPYPCNNGPPHIQHSRHPGQFVPENIPYCSDRNFYPVSHNPHFGDNGPVRPQFHSGASQHNQFNPQHPYPGRPFNESNPYLMPNQQPGPFPEIPSGVSNDSYMGQDRFNDHRSQRDDPQYMDHDRGNDRWQHNPSVNFKRHRDDSRHRTGGPRWNKMPKRDRRP